MGNTQKMHIKLVKMVNINGWYGEYQWPKTHQTKPMKAQAVVTVVDDGGDAWTRQLHRLLRHDLGDVHEIQFSSGVFEFPQSRRGKCKISWHIMAGAKSLLVTSVVKPLLLMGKWSIVNEAFSIAWLKYQMVSCNDNPWILQFRIILLYPSALYLQLVDPNFNFILLLLEKESTGWSKYSYKIGQRLNHL